MNGCPFLHKSGRVQLCNGTFLAKEQISHQNRNKTGKMCVSNFCYSTALPARPSENPRPKTEVKIKEFFFLCSIEINLRQICRYASYEGSESWVDFKYETMSSMTISSLLVWGGGGDSCRLE